MDEENKSKSTGIITVTIKDKQSLYAAYMPFIKNGGLFIPTDKLYKLGEEVLLLINLMEEKEKYPITGRVAWVTPAGAHGNRAAGMGVQFPETEPVGVRNKIETYLAGGLQSEVPTHTM